MTNDHPSISAQHIADVMGIKFNETQLRAIAAPTGPGVIIAGAGAGKTAVMAARVVWLVANKFVSAEAVLGLTFTTLAAAELQERIRHALHQVLDTSELVRGGTEDLSAEPVVSTYHSFASMVLSEHGLRIGMEPDAAVLADVRRHQLAASVIQKTQLPLHELDVSFATVLDAVLGLDDSLADLSVTTARLREFDADIAAAFEDFGLNETTRTLVSTAHKRMMYSQLVDEFRETKKLLNVIDYADMTRLATDLIDKHPTVIQDLRERFGAVLLDEYQDTSTAQRLIIQRIFGDGHNITAVGDGLQSIYSFRGANPANIDAFPRHFAESGQAAPVFSLPVTQRNGSVITEAANVLTESLRQPDVHPFAEPLMARPDPKYPHGRIRIAGCATGAEEVAWLADHFREQANAGIAFHEMAVLVRRNEDVAWYFQQLSDLGIPVQMRTKRNIIHIPEIAEIIAYLNVVAEPTANASWIRILTSARWRLSLRDLAVIAKLATKISREGALPTGRDTDQTESLDSLIEDALSGQDPIDVVAYGDAISYIALADQRMVAQLRLSEAAQQRIVRLHEEIEYYRRHTSDRLGDFIQRIVHTTGLAVELTAHPDRLVHNLAAHVRSFTRLAADFEALDGRANVFAFLRWLDDASTYEQQPTLTSHAVPGAVQLMTMHASKGLQFRVVALPHLNKGIFPSSKASNRWPSIAKAVPDALKPDVSESFLRSYPTRGGKIEKKESDAYIELCQRKDLLDERRLAYVALTRSEDLVLLSHCAEKTPGSKLRPPSVFLLELLNYVEAAADCAVDSWIDFEDSDASDPDNEPEQTSVVPRTFPEPLVQPAFTQTHQVARQVMHLVETGLADEFQPSGASLELDVVRHWDAAIAYLESQSDPREDIVRTVDVPRSLSVTSIQQKIKNPVEFAKNLVRPMPHGPSYGMVRGTNFHAYVERQLRQRLGQGNAVLPGAEEFDPTFEPLEVLPDVAQLCETFDHSEWATRRVVAVEEPFCLDLGGYIVKGKIDAVFESQTPGKKWTVIDWKTNSQATADATQLNFYAIAWAQAQGCSLDDIEVGFYYVRLNETVMHEAQLREAELIALMRNESLH